MKNEEIARRLLNASTPEIAQLITVEQGRAVWVALIEIYENYRKGEGKPLNTAEYIAWCRDHVQGGDSPQWKTNWADWVEFAIHQIKNFTATNTPNPTVGILYGAEGVMFPNCPSFFSDYSTAKNVLLSIIEK